MWLVKSLQKLKNSRLVDNLGEMWRFYNFQYDFRSSGSTTGLLTIVFENCKGFNKSMATLAAALHLSKWIGMTCLTCMTWIDMLVFTNSSLMEFQLGHSTSFHLFSVIDGLEWFWMEVFARISS